MAGHGHDGRGPQDGPGGHGGGHGHGGHQRPLGSYAHGGRTDGFAGRHDAPRPPQPRPVRVYLALGANQGTPILNLKRALKMLSAEAGISVATRSSIYETRPIGPPGQPNYFNAVVEIETTLEPRQLLRRCQAIETGLGRVRNHKHWVPRTMDIDILLYDGRTIIDGHLSVPHPRMAERDFVVVPLTEIAPDATYPGGGPVMLSSEAQRTIVRQVEGAWD